MGISPVFSNLFHFYVRDFSIILIVLFLSAYFIFFLLNNNRSFQRLEKSFKQVSWEFKLLDALLEDVEAVSESGRKIDEKAHQLGNSQLSGCNQNCDSQCTGLEKNLRGTEWKKKIPGMDLLWFLGLQKNSWPLDWLWFVQFWDKCSNLEDTQNKSVILLSRQGLLLEACRTDQ